MMRAMPYNLQAKGGIEVSGISLSQISSSLPKWKLQEPAKREIEEIQVPNTTSSVESDPTSNLDTTRHSPSPSPPTSTSTLFGSSDITPGVADPPCGDRTGAGPGPGGGGGGVLGLEEWDSIFPNGDGALLPWIMAETDDMNMGLKHLLQSGNAVDYEGNAGLGIVEQGSCLDGLGVNGSGFDSISSTGNVNVLSGNVVGSIPASLQLVGYSNPQHQQFDVGDEKPQIYNPQLVMNQQQQQEQGSFLMPPLGGYSQVEQHVFEQQQEAQAKRHNINPGVVLDPNVKNPFVEQQGQGQGQEVLLLRKQQQFGMMGLVQNEKAPPVAVMVGKQQQQNQVFPLQLHHHQEQAVKDELFKAADLIQTGNFSLAQEILARLNHQLSLPATPLVRAAFYVKEALQLLLLMSNPLAAPPPKPLTPFDVVHKINAYKLFSDVSPITHFLNFTSTQAILESLDHAPAIHILDFDIACGAQWASFIQELPLRKLGAPSLKITAFAPLSTTHPFELTLIRENLMQFAAHNGVAFQLHVLNLDLFENPSHSSLPHLRISQDESLAVTFPIWACSNRPSLLPSILRFIKQRSPKIVVSLDRGFDRCDVPFPQHLIHTLESCTNFLESLDALKVASDVATKVEKYFIQPRIENTVLGRVHAPDKMPHWKNLFASSGFMPLQFSNFTETQADYVVKRTPGRGFHVEKRQASLVLNWQRRELVSASAWKC